MKTVSTLLRQYIFISLLLFYNTSLSSQITLDTLEIAPFVSGLSPVVLAKGKAEVNMYSSLSSVWQALYFSAIESAVRDRYRLSEFTTNLEAYYGFSRTGRWDIGIRLQYARIRLDNAAQSSPFKVLKSYDEENDNQGFDKTYAGMRQVGIRFRIIPFRNIPQLALNGGYSFAPANSDNDDVFSIADRNSFDLNASYYISLNKSGTSYYYFILNTSAFQPGSLPINRDWLYNAGGSFFVVQRLGKFVLYPGIS